MIFIKQVSLCFIERSTALLSQQKVQIHRPAQAERDGRVKQSPSFQRPRQPCPVRRLAYTHDVADVLVKQFLGSESLFFPTDPQFINGTRVRVFTGWVVSIPLIHKTGKLLQSLFKESLIVRKVRAKRRKKRLKKFALPIVQMKLMEQQGGFMFRQQWTGALGRHGTINCRPRWSSVRFRDNDAGQQLGDRDIVLLKTSAAMLVARLERPFKLRKSKGVGRDMFGMSPNVRRRVQFVDHLNRSRNGSFSFFQMSENLPRQRGDVQGDHVQQGGVERLSVQDRVGLEQKIFPVLHRQMRVQPRAMFQNRFAQASTRLHVLNRRLDMSGHLIIPERFDPPHSALHKIRSRHEAEQKRVDRPFVRRQGRKQHLGSFMRRNG